MLWKLPRLRFQSGSGPIAAHRSFAVENLHAHVAVVAVVLQQDSW